MLTVSAHGITGSRSDTVLRDRQPRTKNEWRCLRPQPRTQRVHPPFNPCSTWPQACPASLLACKKDASTAGPVANIPTTCRMHFFLGISEEGTSNPACLEMRLLQAEAPTSCPERTNLSGNHSHCRTPSRTKQMPTQSGRQRKVSSC